MAIKLKDESYIKLDLEKCYIDIKGVHVAYFRYADEDTRIREQSSLDALNRLLKNVSDYVSTSVDKLQSSVENYSEIKSKEELLEKLSESDRKLYDTLQNLQEDIHVIISASQIGDVEAEKNLREKSLLKQLGYTSEILGGVVLGVPCGNISGVYLGQKFTHESMYKELKKIFKKDGYIDC